MGAKFWICVSLLSVSLIIILFNKKIRCAKLFQDLFSIFYDYRTRKNSIFDIVCFFVCPIIIGTTIVIGFDYYFSDSIADALLTIFSIIFTLLFGVMSLLTSTLNSMDNIKKKISNEAFTAVAFAMFSSLITLILIIIYMVLSDLKLSSICLQIFSGIIICLSSNLIMLFLMIIKRSYVTSIE